MTQDNPLSKQNIQHIASLARLELQGEELDAMIQHMDKIVQAVSTLSELDTENVQAYHSANQSLGGPLPLREDRIQASLSNEQALSNAPARGPNGFQVPAIHD